MTEYIERDALIDAVESIDWYSVYKGKLTAGAPNTENALYKASSIYAIINNAPSADVAPVQKWISVKDKLLEAGGYVVCIAKRNPFSRFMPMVAKIEKNGWVNPITEQYISAVSHWMPIPEPPKEVK